MKQAASNADRGSARAFLVAAVNSFNAVTLSGDTAPLKKARGAIWSSKEIFQKFLRVEVAYHSPQMDPLREELLAVLGWPHASARAACPCIRRRTVRSCSDRGVGRGILVAEHARGRAFCRGHAGDV